jgi:hypothetical protein
VSDQEFLSDSPAQPLEAPAPPSPLNRIPTRLEALAFGATWTAVGYFVYKLLLETSVVIALKAATAIYLNGLALSICWWMTRSLKGMFVGAVGGAAAASILTYCVNADGVRWYAVLAVPVLAFTVGLSLNSRNAWAGGGIAMLAVAYVVSEIVVAGEIFLGLFVLIIVFAKPEWFAVACLPIGLLLPAFLFPRGNVAK